MTNQPKQFWHIDKAIPLSVVVMFIVQGAGVIWWFSGLSNKVQENAERLERLEAQRVVERVATLEYRQIDDRGSLIRIENKLDRLIEKERDR